ncbi:MAG: aminopeptidase P N-terminal domain-containing protein [Pseudomonadota bacterium]
MTPEEFAARRRQLMRMIGEDGIAIFPAAPRRKRNRDIDYPFRQDSDFFYLTGFAEPDAVGVLMPGREQGEFLLFCRERDPAHEAWHGAVTGPDAAPSSLMADDAFPIDDIDDILPGLLEARPRVYVTMGQYAEFDGRLTEWLNMLRRMARSGSAHTPQEFVALDHLLHDMRLYKSRRELSALRRSARVTVAAHERAMQNVRPGWFEFQLEAEFDHEFRGANARHAYPPIVGGGTNACILHYTANDSELAAGDLVLVDAGCELDYYAADVTRTYPVSGRYSSEQAAIYEVVLAAQLAAIEMLRAGNHWNDPHDAARKAIAEGLIDLGLLHGSTDAALETDAVDEFFMHRTGHWLGIDVHDVGDYRVGDQWRVLEPGMVSTVEPGVYVSHQADVDERWHGIAVRIEDVVAVTRDAPDVLTGTLVKRVDDIEAVMNG